MALTKNGELVYPAVERDVTDDWSDNRLTFVPADTAENRFLWYPGSWATAFWHLHEVGQPEKDGVYELAEDIFGYPFWTGTVYVEWDPTIIVEGFYYITNQTIYLRDWENWNVPGWQQDPDWNDDAAVEKLVVAR